MLKIVCLGVNTASLNLAQKSKLVKKFARFAGNYNVSSVCRDIGR